MMSNVEIEKMYRDYYEGGQADIISISDCTFEGIGQYIENSELEKAYAEIYK